MDVEAAGKCLSQSMSVSVPVLKPNGEGGSACKSKPKAMSLSHAAMPAMFQVGGCRKGSRQVVLKVGRG